jgi:Choice-of-anchor I domain/Bacterial Ig-like domain (group 3)
VRHLRRIAGLAAAFALVGGGLSIAAAAPAQAKAPAYTDAITLTKIAGYSTGATPNPDGGIAEIVQYNSDNHSFYVVNGSTSPASLEIVKLPSSGYGSTPLALTKSASVNIESLLAAKVPGFSYGDLTSVAIDTVKNRVYAAIQEAAFDKPGLIVVLDYDGGYITSYTAGVQPDMVTVASGGRYVISADEGEPRDGTVANDPAGTVTVIDTTTNKVTHVGFADTSKIDDLAHIRGVERDPSTNLMLPRTKAAAVTDFEPEYVTVQGNRAYVTLQENNAVATVDLPSASLVSVAGLGAKDVRTAGNEADLLRDGKIDIDGYAAKMLYMPDGIASYATGGKTYLLTANEGDVAEYIDNSIPVNEIAPYLSDPTAKSFWEGITSNPGDVAADMGDLSVPYFYGARSFSVWNADGSQVFDSGSDIEKITAERLPDHFNISNDKYKTSDFDKRSGKKGPEPENVEVGTVGDKTFAFVGLERIGGVMTYDITDPTKPTFANYINTREFTSDLGGDNSPEGLDFVPAQQSPTGKALLLASFEVGGTVAAYEVGSDPRTSSSVSVTSARSSYGHAARVTVTATSGGMSATGKVGIVVDGRAVTTATLVAGRATVSLPKKLSAGRHTVEARYAGTQFSVPATATGSVVVAKAKTRTSLTLNWSIVKKSNTAKATARVNVLGLSEKATGKVSFFRNGTLVATARLKNGKVVGVRIPVGTHRGVVTIRARYQGSKNLAATTSRAVRLRVV